MQTLNLMLKLSVTTLKMRNDLKNNTIYLKISFDQICKKVLGFFDPNHQQIQKIQSF